MTDLDALRQKLGLSDAPKVREGLEAVDDFFCNTLFLADYATEWFEYLRGIDFHQTVCKRDIPRGTRLVRYESLSESRKLKPFSYFTKPGVSPFMLGTSFPSVEYKEFEVSRTVSALVSTASGMKFGDPRVVRLGGGVQYIISFSDSPALTRVGQRR